MGVLLWGSPLSFRTLRFLSILSHSFLSIKSGMGAMKSWYKNWDVISPIFKFSSDVRKVIYTTNAIESLNSGYRRLNKQRSVFPSDTALLKALYLATHEIAKKWTMPLRNWGKVLGELEIMYPDRLG